MHGTGPYAVAKAVALTMLVFAPVLCTLLLPGQAAAAEMSRFQRLVASLEGAEPASRSRFARAALLQMAEVHLAEAGLARNQSAQSMERERLLGWARAVELYAGQLLELHDRVEQGAPVVLLPELLAHPGILVAGRSTVISHPRGDQQQALEQAILHAFCEQEDCLQLLAAEVELAPGPILESPAGIPAKLELFPFGSRLRAAWAANRVSGRWGRGGKSRAVSLAVSATVLGAAVAGR